MTRHITTTRDEWLAARLDLLEAEKEHTRRSDALAQRRQDLPWPPVEQQRKGGAENKYRREGTMAVDPSRRWPRNAAQTSRPISAKGLE